MNLSQRLLQLRNQSGQETVTNSNWGNTSDLMQRVRLARANALNKPEKMLDENSLAQQLKGDVISPGLIRIENWIELNRLHDCYEASADKPIQHVDQIDNWDQLLFVDTETTGLSTASGTLVFILGAAEIVDGKLRLEQMLITKISAETELLAWFNRKIATKSHLVSYNGKSFDVPLLATRYRMARSKSDLLQKQHIDLLHWIRRCHRKHMRDCRLPTAEQHCLGFTRKDDLPGSEAPNVWQEMLRFANVNRVEPLVQHHAWDVISLTGLLHYVESVLGKQREGQLDYSLVAKHYINSQQETKAKQLLERNKAQLDAEALYLLSHIYRREEQWNKAVEIWQQLVQINFVPAFECLAKNYEHREKQYDIALIYTERLISLERDSRHETRRQRLIAKVKKV